MDFDANAVGDAALKLFAAVVQKSLSGEEHLLRLGGEEFALLLPGCDGARALHRVNTLRLSVQQSGKIIDGTPCELTVSIGVAQLGVRHLSIDALLNEADQALYAAKHAGRNRAVFFEDISTPTGAKTDAKS